MVFAKELSQNALDEALILAASAGSEEAVKLLINRGANVRYTSSRPSALNDARDGFVGSALRAAIDGHHQDMVKLLVLEYHAQIDEIDASKTSPTLLEEALAEGHQAIFKMLLDFGAPISPELLNKAICANFHMVNKDNSKSALFL
ncbi:hypothetical protein F5884DRAFT_404953 [Xylogone sp. PMI_703]|nr:hypothetical protein F5884DRAFT_404953 [Xylogone sp. PMI_703]